MWILLQHRHVKQVIFANPIPTAISDGVCNSIVCNSRLDQSGASTVVGYSVVTENELDRSLNNGNINVDVECAPGYGLVMGSSAPNVNNCQTTGSDYTISGCNACGSNTFNTGGNNECETKMAESACINGTFTVSTDTSNNNSCVMPSTNRRVIHARRRPSTSNMSRMS